MNSLRNPLVWQAVFAAALLLTLAANQPTVTALVPLLVAIALVYVLVRVAWVLIERRARAAPPGLTAVRPVAPPIHGQVGRAAAQGTVDPIAIRTYLSSRVIGQDDVIEQLARGIARRLGQDRRGRPVFTALLGGPSGSGKTELAKALADFLYGRPAGLFQVDCASGLDEAGVQRLIGSPAGEAGGTRPGALTAHLRATPETVLLFDEVEQALTSPEAPLAEPLLSLLDEGAYTEPSHGTRVEGTDAVILMTSNAAAEKLGDLHRQLHQRPEELIRATKESLRDVFAPEFLARIDLVTTLAPLDDGARARIVALHVGRIGASSGVEIDAIDASFVNQALHLWSTGRSTGEVVRWAEEVLTEPLNSARRRQVARVRIGWADGRAEVEVPQ